jgi:hypothetical protein
VEDRIKQAFDLADLVVVRLVILGLTALGALALLIGRFWPR